MEPAAWSGAAAAPAAPAPLLLVQDGVVSRPGLLRRLTEAQRVAQVSAPPGSGKTVLLRSWIAQSGLAGRAAWVTVPGDVRRAAVLDLGDRRAAGHGRRVRPGPRADGGA